MSVEIDRIEIMHRAENAISLWKSQIEGLVPLMKDKTGDTCLHAAIGRLDGFLTWINQAIICEKTVEKKGKEKNNERR